MTQKLPIHVQTALVFAARYAHDRKTAGAMVVVQAIKHCWKQLDEKVQRQIINETISATTNITDWKDLRDFAEKHPTITT